MSRLTSTNTANRSWVWLTCCVLQFACLAQSAAAQPPDLMQRNRGNQGRAGDASSLSSAEVARAIKLGVAYLKLAQDDKGGWREIIPQNCGASALVTLALLNCGENPESPAMRNALDYLRKKPPEATYSVALQTMVFCALTRKSKEDLPLIERNCRWLVSKQLKNGSWSYPASGGDPSNSQFALLALHEGQRAGVKLADDERSNAEVWKECLTKAEAYWHGLQLPDGSFPYDSPEGRGSMTCAGIASLIITASELSSMEAQPDGDSVQCCGGGDDRKNRLAAAMRWLAANFQVAKNPNNEGYHFYYLYALERAGRMTGSRFIGKSDWYREGAQQLLSHQDKLGGGQFTSHSRFEGPVIVDTAFALLFLSKGKRQIVISRMEYGTFDKARAKDDGLGRTEDWNIHRQAMQHLTMATESVWKRELAWQTVDISKATVADLLETPVLFISGQKGFQPSDAQREKLRSYVEQGGFIFAEACNQDGCDGAKFEEDFKKFVADTFEKPLEKLSPDHPIWNVEARVDPKFLPHDFWLYGVQSCCRLGVVYSPISLSCRWELNAPFGIKASRPAKLQAELDNATKIGINVLSFATGKQLKEKLDAVSILEGNLPTLPGDRGTLIIPKLEHGAGADDAPRALSNLMLWMDRENPFQISNEHRMISVTESELEKYPIVFMHGRGSFRFSEKQRAALRHYFENGGFLFADAICANEDFATSFRREMDLILPGKPLEKLPENHPMLMKEDFHGYDVRKVRIIDPSLAGDKIVAGQREIAPQLEVVRMGDLIPVVFSPLDMSCALESRHSLQCRGYMREDAARLGINIILFGLQQ